MQKLTLFILILVTCFACLEMEPKPERGPSSLPAANYETATIRWSNELVSTSNLNLMISSDFSDQEKASIGEIISTWNVAHEDLSFISETRQETSNLNTSDLNVYRDNTLGIYKSYSWFDELSSFALGVTQFYATRRNAGMDSEYLEILHADIILNYKDYNFDANDKAYSGYDLYSVILHEMGHFLGLKHTRHVEDVMSPYLDTGELKHTLSANDVNLLNNLYTKTISSLSKKAVSGSNSAVDYDEEVIRGIIELMPCGCQKARFEITKKPIF
ncbi:MAG: hypothetical protein A2381_20085 [Bdellovibrionales bacterium RIFOXYB1_FULL_37_110]|nr:MAG: hypothetical protein A2181_03720 [Bdellovibrionales bacterium RIFOXYA1_FULL_38_20]OFZ51038.1 MAG: hypothetical protein A2417_19870 [Bdellovibrionales bacterium RIFOXYC1_FULL_37_79]OFZ60250.1 MAG: hypothetical protein A2381_20085 [Bdellovibrionales bacterium RIFOXYB1_FULL_37_110]OFZ63245.1 MAG: hypothetical protein A2577_01400 [Bdellovibrionales bacterium RIFOXYD1_FULL_36_51]